MANSWTGESTWRLDQKTVSVRIREDIAWEAMELHVPQLFCQACLLWLARTQFARAGERLFPNWTARSVLNELRRFARAKAWRNADKLGTRPLRKGAARAFLGAGGSFSRLLRSDNGVFAAFQPYLDMGREEKQAVASVLLDASGEVF